MSATLTTNGASAPDAPHVGRALRRKEDPRLITGRARYIDDISLPGMLWMSLVRSPEAHAGIVSIDVSAARERRASTRCSLGAKGVGEAGTIAASPAVTNAVIDALRPLGVTYINMPLTPMRVWGAIAEAQEETLLGGAPA
jgi:CO/xanthine dehydrogenase Mo-binding subunit